MKKSLILSALASSILLGCGGGGGGSSSSPAPVTKYNFEFVQFADAADAPDISPKTCTLFDTDLGTQGEESFARLANDVKVETYDAEGKFYKELNVSTQGKLTISDNDVPDGGYVSVIDETADSEYKVISIHKTMLSDMMISVEKNQGALSDCYVSDKKVETEKGFVHVTSGGISTDGYAFDSSMSQVGGMSNATASAEVESLIAENILVRAYHNNMISDYVFVSKLAEEKNDIITDLSGVSFEPKAWTNDIPSDVPTNEVTTMNVRLSHQDFSYPWSEQGSITNPITNPTTPISVTPQQSDWTYTATGKQSNWKFTINGALSDNQSVILPNEITISDSPVSIAGSVGDYEFDTNGFSSNIQSVYRGSYKVENAGSPRKSLSHTIYAVVPDGENLSIPNLKVESDNPELDASLSFEVTIDTMSANSLTPDLKLFFMRENAANDLVSVVTKPAETKKQNQVKYMSSYTLLSR